jgi:hypothetical protein
MTDAGPVVSRAASAAAFAAMVLLGPACQRTLAAQQPPRARTNRSVDLGLIATCCQRTEALWERYLATPPANRPLELAFLGAQGFTGALYAVVKDTVTWGRLWSGMHHGILHARTPGESPVPYEPPLPYVDFGREMLILVGTGTRATGGYSVQIDSVRLGRSSGGTRELRVYVTEWRPGRSCGMNQVITSPVALARVRRLHRLDVAVRFIDRARYMRC